MAQKWISGLKRLPAAWRRHGEASGPDRQDTGAPVLSVVVPVFNAGDRLTASLLSLLEQNVAGVEVVVVDDGSTDGSLQTARSFAATHPAVTVLERTHAGVGAARNAGAQAARGEFLAFCDADDVVPANGYTRLVRALHASGSDLAVGSLTVQTKGRNVEPDWARTSRPERRLGVRLDDVPELMTNLVLGCRVFRATFWRENGFRFDEDSPHAGPVTVATALAAARSVDVLPAVVYRWQWREDGRSLLQRSLVDTGQMTDRVSRLVEAAEAVAPAGGVVQGHLVAGLLQSSFPDLVRAAMSLEPEYWATLSAHLRRLLELASPDTFAEVPVEDRMIGWLCAHDRRATTEQFLDLAFQSHFGYPFRPAEPRPRIVLPFDDDAVPADLLTVAPADMKLRTRLTALRWLDSARLLVQGGAFVEYVDDAAGTPVVELVLRDRPTGEEVRIPTRPDPDAHVNEWANRAHEDHTLAGFVAVIDTSDLPDRSAEATYDVEVTIAVDGQRRSGPFQSRTASGSAGLLEASVAGDRQVTPGWRPFDGLRLTVGPAADGADVPERRAAAAGTVAVTDVEAGAGALRVRLATGEPVEVALVGPRARSPWVAATPAAAGSTAELPLLLDEWGLGATVLPEDKYEVRVRVDGRTSTAVAAADLWRQLPRPHRTGDVRLAPLVSGAGALSLHLTPAESEDSRAQYARRRLRDVDYPASRRAPLLDVAFFETFAGKAAGDHPGALCAELARRDAGLDLAFSVVDRSVQVPAGARPVVRWSAEWFELLGRSRYLVVNAALPYFFRKREDQLCLQTWHGTPLKRIAHDRPHLDFLNWHHARRLLEARDGWDLLLSQSEFCTGALRSAFRYEGPVLELGYPRNDILLSVDADDVRRRTREHFGITDDQRVILYAPTWRDNLRRGRVYHKVVYLEAERLTAELPETVVLVRGHYNSVGAAEESDPSRRIIDVTRYPDIGDLYLAADALVTDYSSVFFDFAITDKPMVFLAPDLVEYRDENRGFYLDYHETVPGPVCTTTDGVIRALTEADEFVDRRAAFRARFAPLDDGKASARVVDALLERSPSR